MIGFHGGRMASVFPESTLAPISLIELLGGDSHGPGNVFGFSVAKHEGMPSAVRCGRIVEGAQPV